MSNRSRSMLRGAVPMMCLLMVTNFACNCVLLNDIGGPASANAAGLLIADGGFGGQLEIEQHDVKVTINNGIAVTEVNQVFVNTEDRIVEALYTFPVPKGASVANFSMWIGGKEMIGEVVEKERARQIYESYKTTRRDPGLLEQVDYKRFEMRIFPIPAGAKQRVRVTYYQELDFDHNWANYVYPLATVSQPNADQRTTGKFALTLETKSEIPIAEMESTSHVDEFVIADHTPNYYQASLETSGGDLSRDVVIGYRVERPRTGIDLITSKQNGEDGYFQLTFTAGPELAPSSEGMDYVFILDVSGSMANDGKLRLSRRSIDAFVESLGPADRFELITFNVTPHTMFNDLTPTTDETKQQAAEFLASRRAAGGTVLRATVETAYRYQADDRELNIVILSDGMTEQDQQAELIGLINERPSGSRVFCIGVGNEVNRPLLQQVADRAGGLAAFLSQEDNFERQAEAFRRKLTRPAGTNMKMQFAGGDVYDVEPRELSNLYHGTPLRVYGRYKTSGKLNVQIQGDVQGAPLDQTIELTLPAADGANPEIERMWAWHRVERLMNDERSGKTGGRDEIVRLCEGYSIISQHASFIVLENDAEYKRWKIDRRNAVRINRDRAAQANLRRELEQLRQQSVANLGPRSKDAARPSQQVAQGPATSSAPVDNSTSHRGADIDWPTTRDNIGGGGGSGGGAIDPITGTIAAGLASAAWASRRRRRKKE